MPDGEELEHLREQGKKKWIFYAIKYVFEPPFGHLYCWSLGI